MRARALLIALTLTSMGALPPRADAGETTLTYQGALSSGGVGASGFFDMTFRLYSAASGGTLLGTVSTGVQVIGGVFSAELDFGADAWSNADRWLEITVDGVTLAPRQAVTRSPYAITTRGVHVNSAGQVGIGGTATTGNMLTIRDADANLLLLSQGNNFGPKVTLRNPSSSTSTVHGNIIFDDGSQLAAIGYVKPFIGPAGLQFSGAGDVHMKITESGRVGIGSLDPQELLHINGFQPTLRLDHEGDGTSYSEIKDGTTGQLRINKASNTGGILLDLNPKALDGASPADVRFFRETDTIGAKRAIFLRGNFSTQASAIIAVDGGDSYFQAHGGNLGVGTTDPQAKLHVNGTARVNILEIVGADLAEKFPTSEGGPIEPGTVLEIDPDHAGHLRIASTARSTLVAGVVSGAGGLSAGTIMGNLPGSEDHTPVALSGRVWVKCDASDAPIRPGDMLTTSSTPGHAMRTPDPSDAQGAIIGKAMTPLERGDRGLVLVLVNLQ